MRSPALTVMTSWNASSMPSSIFVVYFRTGDETYKHFYIGEKLKQLHHRRRGLAEENGGNLLKHDEQAILSVIGAELTDSQQARLREELQDLSRVILGESATTLKVLLVGDCLFLISRRS